MNFIRALIDESSQTHPFKDFRFDDPYEPPQGKDYTEYCLAFETWRRECLGKGLKSAIISCVIYFLKIT